MTVRRTGIAALLAGAAACGSGVRAPEPSPTTSAATGVTSLRELVRTTPETTSYRRTSTYGEVIHFLEMLRTASNMRGRTLAFGDIGRTSEGRPIPYVIASRPMVTTPDEARASGKPVVYVQANIHGGEVEGKEALLALLRDLAFATGPNVLDSIVLVAVPIYNADGNERWGPQDRQRTEQNGPVQVGQRANAQGLDLNRDYVKAEAPETRAALAMLDAWNPDVFVDLHTTDGSYHGYALTYSPSLHPSAPLGEYSRTLLSELRRRVRDRDRVETFDYGNFDDRGQEVSTDTVHAGWYTYDHRPRFGTNYMGLRGRIAVLSEAYSHDPLERRVRSTYAFVRQLLSLVAERGPEIRGKMQTVSLTPLALRSALPATASAQPVTYEILAATGDSTSGGEPGVARGFRRTGTYRTRAMPVFDRFRAVQTTVQPDGGYLIDPRDTAVVALLARHGLLTAPWTGRGPVEEFVVDSIVHNERAFQGHHEVRLRGQWRIASDVPSSAVLVSTRVPLDLLAAALLEPESDDGLVTWNLFDTSLAVGRPFPVRRVRAPR